VQFDRNEECVVDGSILELALALAVGAGLGLWFFAGLLWTLRRLPNARHPVVLVIFSFVIRTTGVVAGLIWLAGRHWLLPLAALAGFVAVRQWLLRTWGKPRLGT
jgi:F1F0 ATPase subunit 2